MTGKREGFRNDIAGLRALAVILVLACHFGIPGFSFGFIGVDIFFVISGYLITRLLYKEYLKNSDSKASNGYISLTAFYLRRIRRLLPAAVAVIVLANVASYFLSNSESREKLLLDSKWALLFLANVSFLRSESNYFQLNSEPSLLQHYWSLSVEEQFYFIWPILFILAAHFHKLRIRHKYFRYNLRIVSLILVITLFSFLFLQMGFQSSPKSVYFSIFTRAWELGIGGLAGILSVHKKNSLVFSHLERYIPASLALILCGIFISSDNWAYWVALPVVTIAFFLYAGDSNPKSSMRKPNLIGRSILFTGEISYSLYLVHWPIYVLCARFDYGDQFMEKISFFPISFFMAYFLWKMIEKPFQKIKLPNFVAVDKKMFSIAKKSRSAIITASFFVVGSLYVVTYPTVPANLFFSSQALSQLKNDPNLMNYAQFEKQLISLSATNSAQTSEAMGNPSQTETQTSISDLGEWTNSNKTAIQVGLKQVNLTNNQQLAFKNLKFDMSPFEKSNCGSQNTEVPPNCSTGNQNGDAPKVALIGDSKMGHLAQPIIDYFSENGWKVEPLVLFGCRLSNPANDFQTNCVKRSEYTRKKIATEKYDLVISAEYPVAPILKDSQKKYYLDIAQNTKRLIIFQQTPSFPNAQDCITSEYQIAPECMISDQKELPSWKQSRLFDKSLASTRIEIVDTVDWYCQNYRCPITIDEVFVLRDGKHFTYSFAKKISPVLYYYLNKIKSSL